MTTRETILRRVYAALENSPRAQMPELPVEPRLPDAVESQIALTLAAIENVGGHTRRLVTQDNLRDALADLVRAENVKCVTLWQTPEILALADLLTPLGVEILSPYADKHALAQCDLGITGADAVLPQTGTLVLGTSVAQPQAVSLVPRVHLAVFSPRLFRANLAAVFAQIKHARHAVLITGPSRTADIEKILQIGVHGPKAFYAWCDERSGLACHFERRDGAP